MAFLLIVACDCSDVVATRCVDDTDCDGACVGGRCELPDGARDVAFDAPDGDTNFCLGTGPLIVVGDTATTCLGRVAERSFRYAICTCDGVVTSAEVRTDSFDSRRGSYMPPGEAGGSLGTNADLNASAPWSIGGSFWSSGPNGWTSDARLEVAGDLRLQGRLAGDVVEVGRNAFVGGGVQAGDLRVDGVLTVPTGETIRAERSEVIGETVREPVEIPRPCACEDRVDITSFVAAHRDDNDNAAIELGADALVNVSSSDRLELPCGRYYLSQITGDVPVVIRATGRVALFVDGDISVRDLRLELSDEAELDILVVGNVTADALGLGDVSTPARVRMYVDGTGTINLSADSVFAGNLYAPRAELVTRGPAEVFGALFVERINASGPLDVHFDTGVLGSGDRCEPPPDCESCGDCPSIQACVDGSCGECRTDADCCAPLLCVEGACLPSLI